MPVTADRLAEYSAHVPPRPAATAGSMTDVGSLEGNAQVGAKILQTLQQCAWLIASAQTAITRRSIRSRRPDSETAWPLVVVMVPWPLDSDKGQPARSMPREQGVISDDLPHPDLPRQTR